MTGCTLKHEVNKEESRQQEVIQSFFIVGNTIYGIGQLHSYQFRGEPDNSLGAHTIPKLIQFLQDKSLMQKVTKADIGLIRYQKDKNEVNTYVSLTVDVNKLSQQDLAKIESTYTNNIDKTKKGVLAFSLAGGSVTQIQNRAEILKRTSLAHPLKAPLITYSSHTEEDKQGSTLATTMLLLPVSAVLAPFAIVKSIVD